jgi:hypothetical protein
VIEENINELLPLANGHPLWFLFHPHSSSCHFPAPPGVVIKENINYLLPLPNWYPFQSLFPPHPSSSILPAPQSAIVVEHKDVICMLLSQVNWDPFDVDSLHPILVHQYQHQSLPYVSFLVLSTPHWYDYILLVLPGTKNTRTPPSISHEQIYYDHLFDCPSLIVFVEEACYNGY